MRPQGPAHPFAAIKELEPVAEQEPFSTFFVARNFSDVDKEHILYMAAFSTLQK
jgi:hypothetical protein